MTKPNEPQLDGQRITEQLRIEPTPRQMAGQDAAPVETFEFKMAPEAHALIVTARRDAFAEPADFAVVAINQLIGSRSIDRELMVDLVRSAQWPSLSEHRLGQIFDHLDFQFPRTLEATMAGPFEIGWILDDTWDIKSVIYATTSNLVGLFWATYV